jgi:hypothetical protein
MKRYRVNIATDAFATCLKEPNGCDRTAIESWIESCVRFLAGVTE